MKAILFDGELTYTDKYPVPEPQEGEALIRVNMAGICNTDLEIIKGYLDFKGVLGHEFVGMVEKVNGVSHDLSGKRVVGEINCACGVCDYCLKGLKTHCPDRKTLGITDKDGAFAEHITLPLDNLFVLPDNIADEEAVFTEPLAAAFEILEQIHIRPTDKILIMGDGKLGILIALVLNLTQADVTLAGKHDNKLTAASNQGVKTIKITSLFPLTKSYDIVVEATGTPEGFELALQLVNPRGKVVLKSTVAKGKEINLAPVVIDEIQVIGSRCGPFEPALSALSRKLIDVKPLITEVYRPEQAKEAFEKAKEKDSLKVLIDFR
jgi:threonine dehydrogenase-like Zn-dependent dehydrogenase